MNENFIESGQISKPSLMDTLLNTNSISAEYGLSLSEKDTLMLINAGRESIAAQDRIEFGKSATVKIIDKFMQSAYITQDIYADTIASLIEIFYEAKEESMDILTDDEVIDIMFYYFENESGGVIEVLQNRDMEELCRRVRYAAMGIDNGDNSFLSGGDADE